MMISATTSFQTVRGQYSPIQNGLPGGTPDLQGFRA